LIARGWKPGTVAQWLERAGDSACRPDELGPEFGLREGSYYLSAEQAQAILDLRLHRLTGMEHEKLLAEYQEKLLIRLQNILKFSAAMIAFDGSDP
jgi:DNA gyrase subunit A